jgi:DNA-binding response OmpR family regulator
MIVLLVEDDDLLRRLLEVSLPPEFEVQSCSAGAEAVQKLADRDVDVLLTDLDLPEVSGEELARLARAVGRPVGVVIMSANRGRLEAARGLADAVVAKPFSCSAIRAALRCARARQERDRRRGDSRTVRSRRSRSRA